VEDLGSFHSLAIVNNAAINMGVQVHFCNVNYYPFGIPKSDIAESFGRSILVF
jgi:hypothetical protein